MGVPSTHALLGAWEGALGAPPHERPLRMLAPLLAGRPDAGETRAETRGETLSVGERDRLLMELRERAFGSRVDALATCPECGESLEVAFDLSDIRVPPHGDPGPRAPDGDHDGSRTLERDGYRIRFRPVLHRDLAAVAASPLDAAADSATGAGPDAATGAATGAVPDSDAVAGRARRALLARCVLAASRGGSPVAVDELPADVEAALAEALREADPQADVRLELGCPACGAGWVAPFDIGAFLWMELDAWSRRTLETVHRLARAYGWSEAEILALSPARRRHYLGLIGA